MKKYAIRPAVLDKIRVDNNLSSDEQLANHLGLTLGTISRIRRGYTPNVPTLVKIMQAAHVTHIDASLIEKSA